MTNVSASSEAEKVGILVDDIILEYHNQKLYGNYSYLLSLLDRYKNKENVEIKILRGEDTLLLKARDGDLGI